MLPGRKRKTSPPLSSRILRKVKVSLQMEFLKFKGTVCVISTDSDRALSHLHRGSLEITITVSLGKYTVLFNI